MLRSKPKLSPMTGQLSRKSITGKRGRVSRALASFDKVIESGFNTDGYIKMNDKITEELHYKPAEFYVLRIIRPVLKKLSMMR